MLRNRAVLRDTFDTILRTPGLGERTSGRLPAVRRSAYRAHHMRWRITLAVLGLLAGACRDGGAKDQAGDDLCGDALRLHGEALADAIASTPPCKRDEDCTVMADRAACEDRVVINLCELPVHHGVVDAYDAQAVAERICALAEDSELGCEISASCAAHGEPVCRDGECVFAAP
jgi:hypothetical protein